MVHVRMTGIGIDMEEISRFSKNKFEIKKSFYQKIFTQEEINYCLNHPNPYPHFAARFCAKEASIKALKNKNFGFLDIEIKMKNNVPALKLPSKKKGIVSMSHTKKYAIACVVIL